MLEAGVAVWILAAASSAPPPLVAWEQVEPVVARTVCVEKSADGVLVRVGVQEACGAAPPATVLERAVRAAFADSGSLLVSLRLDRKVRAELSALDEAAWNNHARRVFLENPSFLRALVPRIRSALAAGGLECDDCPRFAWHSPRSVRWDVFGPYFGAHVWPDPVEPHVGPDGVPTGKRRYPYHICIDLNGIDAMTDPDPELVRAGFVLAMDAPVVSERADELIRAIIKEPELLALPGNEERTAFMRKRLPALIAADPAVKRGVCELLVDYTIDLGIWIEECGPRPAAP